MTLRVLMLNANINAGSPFYEVLTVSHVFEPGGYITSRIRRLAGLHVQLDSCIRSALVLCRRLIKFKQVTHGIFATCIASVLSSWTNKGVTLRIRRLARPKDVLGRIDERVQVASL